MPEPLVDKTEELRRLVEYFPLYRPGESVFVCRDETNFYVHYGCYKHEDNLSNFDLQITGDTCFILTFNIPSEERRRGNGRSLYNVIERFCTDSFNTTRFRTTPSGFSKQPNPSDGKCFWEKMGFSYINGVEVEKIL